MHLDLTSSKPSWIEVYRLCIGFINPRPIALVSTLSPAGESNLAPFSFYNMVCARPPVVMISCGKNRHGRDKHTFENIASTREFAIATVTREIADRAVRCGADLPAGQSEFEFAGLSPVPASAIRAPLVRESPINVECRLREIIHIGDNGPGSSNVIFGDILAIHVADELLDPNGHIDPHKLTATGRLGGAWYADADDPYTVEIPKIDETQKFVGG